MSEDFIKQLLDILKKDLHIKENGNFVDTLFEERAENFHTAIINNGKYKKEQLKIKSVNSHIFAKYDNAIDIINTIEQYEEAYGNMGYLIEKQMYKYGVYDGMRLILDGLHSN